MPTFSNFNHVTTKYGGIVFKIPAALRAWNPQMDKADPPWSDLVDILDEIIEYEDAWASTELED